MAESSTPSLGICGDDCAACPRFVATETGGPRDLEIVRRLWVRLGLRDPSFPAAKLACRGCLAENDCAYPDMRACARSRSLPNCGWCADYPCELVSAVFARTEAFAGRVADVCSLQEAAVLEEAGR